MYLQGFAHLPGGICMSTMGRHVSYEQAVVWKVFAADENTVHCLAFSFVNWSFVWSVLGYGLMESLFSTDVGVHGRLLASKLQGFERRHQWWSEICVNLFIIFIDALEIFAMYILLLWSLYIQQTCWIMNFEFNLFGVLLRKVISLFILY